MDRLVVRIQGKEYPLPITEITAGSYRLHPTEKGWQIQGQSSPYTVTFQRSLRIGSFNLGFNVMSNQVKGSESPRVTACQKAYGGGWHTPLISSCTFNAAKFLSDYDLFGLQEVNPQYRQGLIDTIQSARPDAQFNFISGYRGVMVGFNVKKTGPGVQITPPDYTVPSTPSQDNRGMQAVWFPQLQLLFINLHAPHNIPLRHNIEINLAQIATMLNQTPERVIMVGDFNDWQGTLLKESVTGLGRTLRVPQSKLVKSCCADSGYSYPGDYIFVDTYHGEYYGLPPGYNRDAPMMSDHDPVVLLTYI